MTAVTKKKKKNRQNDVLFVRNGRELGTRKTYLEGTIFNTCSKSKKKYVVTLKIFVVFILDEIVY